MSQRLRPVWLGILAVLVTTTVLAQERAGNVNQKIWSIVSKAAVSATTAAPQQQSRVNRYSSVIKMKDMQPEDSPDVPMTSATNTTQSENSIFVSPLNPNIVLNSNNSSSWPVTGIFGASYFVSTDAGLTWTGSVQGAGGTNSGDPATAIGRNGHMFIGYIASNDGQGVARSIDNGVTWVHAQVAPSPGSLADKNHLWIDNSASSPFQGNLYDVWTDFGGTNDNQVVVSRSTDDGLTWSARIPISAGTAALSHNQGVNVQTGPDGTVYATWAVYDAFPDFEKNLGFSKSTDGGVTWSTAARVGPVIKGIRSQATGGGLLGGKNMRTASFPSMSVNGQNGHVYIVWTNIGVPGTNSGTERDNYFIKSTDGGATWGTAVRINQDVLNNGKDQWFPWIACDPVTGGLAVAFYDSRDFAANDQANTYVAVSRDEGATWEDFRVSDASWDGDGVTGFSANYAGDYIGISARQGKVYPVWSDKRSGNMLAYTSPFTLAMNVGYAAGQITSGGNPVAGVAVDFITANVQIPGVSDGAGNYIAGAEVDTLVGHQQYTMRAQKFGYLTYQDTVTLVLADTVTRNIVLTAAPGGTLAVHAYTAPNVGKRAAVTVNFNGSPVINDFTDSLTGNFSTPLPVGTYQVIVNPASPYATRTFDNVSITAGTTTTVEALLRAVFEFSPVAVRDTLPVGGVHIKTLGITNTTSDTVHFRITDDNALRLRRIRTIVPEPKVQPPAVEKPKGAPATEFGMSPLGSGGPDAFGYSWIDSDEPGGPTFSWFDISTIGTQITTWTGNGDDGNTTVALPWSFPLYGNTYASVNIVTNGFVNFGATSSAFSNGAIPSTATPNNAIYPYWDDFDVRTSGKVLYYNDAANGRFIVQWDKAPHYVGTPAELDTVTFQAILKPNGEVLLQYLHKVTLDSTQTIGVENADGSVALQVLFNRRYVHDSLAVRIYLPDAPWLSETPAVGAVPPGGSQNVQCTFDATGLTPGTVYNANMSIEGTHPDVSSPFIVPASLQVQTANGPLIVLSKTSITIPTVAIGQNRKDSLTARNVGDVSLAISSITNTNTDFTVTPASANVAPGDSVKIYVTYTPTVPAGSDTGTVSIVSNSTVNPTATVALSANSVGVPVFLARVDSLTKTLQARGFDSTQFFVRNTGTMSGNFAARAVMYPRAAAGDKPGKPIIIPMTIKPTANVAKARANSVSSGAPSAERSPFNSPQSSYTGQAPLAQFDMQFDHDAVAITGAAGNAAAVFINNEFWTSRWATNVLHRWNANGTLIEQFTITGVTGVRGLTTDGTYLYASTNTAAIHKIDPVTKTLVSTITCASPVTTRAIAYDPVRDGFWVSNFADALSCVNRSGAVIATITNTLAAKYGAAYDGYTAGGPYLWVFDQTNTAGGTPQNIWQFDLNTLTSTGVSFDVLTRVTTGGTLPIAGGLFIATGIVPGKVTIGGLLQGGGTGPVDRLFGLELGDAGSGSGGPWLAIAPPSGTIAVGDSTQFTATFDARSEGIINNPGDYFGRIEITASNSALADSLNIPVHFTVTPVTGAAMIVTPDSVGVGNVAIGVTDSSKTFLVKNIGTAALNVTNIASSNPAFSPSITSFSLNTNDTTRIRVRFTAPTPAGLRQGTFTFTSNDPGAPTVKVSGTSIGQANIVVQPDSFSFAMNRSTDTTTANLKIKNPGTDTLRFAINEAVSASSDIEASIARSTTQQEIAVVAKGASDPTTPQPASPNGRGGPDAFGYSWIDSDEPGGPVFSWVDIASVGTPITTWTGSADDGYSTVTLPWAFTFYGNPFTSINVVTNGFLNFGATSSSFSNGALPSTGVPNNALYPYWDDFDLRTSGQVLYYDDAANSRFIVQWNNAPHYIGSPAEPDTVTFQVILKPSGEILYQFLRKASLDSTQTVGIENSTGTVALQVSYNARYVRPNLAIRLSKDLVPWLSVDRTSGTIAPGDSTNIQLRIVPDLTGGVYIGRERITGNTPDVVVVPVRLAVSDTGAPSITVTAPNGGENWEAGSAHSITWTKNNVDSVKIEYSTNNGTTWTVVSSGVPARPEPWIHPKAAAGRIGGGVSVSLLGTYSWTVPNTPTTTALVRISQKSNAAVVDVSNATFTISPAVIVNDTSWVVQTSGSTAAFYSVKTVNSNVVWVAGAAGAVLRTTNGGTNWTSVGGGAIGTADIYAIEALDANTALVTTSPGATFIYRTTNGGSTWAQVYTLAGGFMDGIVMTSATNGYAVGDPVGGKWVILNTVDGGATWVRMATEPTAGAEAGWNNAFVHIGNTLWFGTNVSKVYRSTDLGATWASSATTMPNSYAVWFNNPTTGMAGGATGVTNRSTDGGVTWTVATAAGAANVTGIGGTNGTEFWATNGNNAYYTSNHGAAWTAAPKNGYTGTLALNHLMMVGGPAGSTYGWTVGASGRIVRYRRIVTGVAGTVSEIPTVYALDQNFPNPFNPTTTIRFALPEQATVSLKIYNLLGQEIATLAEGDMQAAFHNVVWNGRNNNGAQVATGLYFYRMEATGVSGEKFNSLKKLILLK